MSIIDRVNKLFSETVNREICRSSDSNENMSLADFQLYVTNLRAMILQHDAQRWLLYTRSTARFCVGFFALAGLEKKIVLCTSVQPGWISKLSPEFDAVISDVSVPTAGKPLLDITLETVDAQPWQPRLHGAEEIVFFTSGSTGSPKAVPKSLNQLLNEVELLENTFGSQMKNATVYASVSHLHIYGLLFRFLWPLLMKRVWYEQQIEFQEQLLAVLDGQKPGVFVSSPAFLSRLDSKLPDALLEVVFSSGGPLSFEAARQSLEKLSRLPIEVYGSTETGGIGFRSQSAQGTPWQLFANVKIRQTDNRITVTSGHTIPGQETVIDDRLEMLNQSAFLLHGRADRIAKVEEKRVSLTEIEQFLTARSDILDCAAFTMPAGGSIRTVCAVVLSESGKTRLAKTGSKALLRQWRQDMAHQFDLVAIPRKWRFMDELSRNSQGKLNWQEIRSKFEVPVNTTTDLPEILESTDSQDRMTFKLLVSEDLNVFDGHFENAPVVAGVIQIKWVVELYRRYHAGINENATEELRSVKFQHVIQPGAEINLEIEFSNERLNFKFHSEKGQHSSGVLVLH